MLDPMIETGRLVLRHWMDTDRAPFAALNADPEVVRYFRGPLDRTASDAFIDRIEAGCDTLGYGLWAVEVRSTQAFIGFTGLALQTFKAHFSPAVEIGWRLTRSAWGHGYASEAARAALTYGFAVAGLDEIVASATRTNERSRAVMDRIGMTRDPHDDFDYPLLPEDHPLVGAPGAQVRLLHQALGVVGRPGHAVAVREQLAAVSLGPANELVALWRHGRHRRGE
jgi:RimJ/RimL family protein N-acetyltransferase